MITRTFKLCLNAGTGSAPFINVSQTDKDEVWLFELYTETGERYIPSSGAIIGIKADGYGIANTGTVDSEGRVVITETEQITAASGRAIYELSIDGLTHGTANFIVNVEKKPIDGAIMSDSDLSLISQAIDSAAVIVDVIGDGDPSEVIGEHVDAWLDNHPEATTTVLDGAITAPKLNQSLWDKLLVSEEASGAVASFDDGADDVPVSSLKVALEPVQLGSGDPSPSNIRPIIASNGINAWDEVWELGGISNQNGTNYVASDRIRSKNYIPCLPNTTYYFKTPATMGTVAFYNSSRSFISALSNFAGGTFTTPVNTQYIRFCGTNAYGATYNHDISINYPSSYTAYQPYQGIMVERCGKNLFDKDNVNLMNAYINGSGTILRSTPDRMVYAHVKPNTDYSVTFTQKALTGSAYADDCQIGFYATKPELNATGTRVYSQARPSATVDYVYTFMGNSGNNSWIAMKIGNAERTDIISTLATLQIEEGSATTYVPYEGNSYPYTLGQSVYGGTVDLATGVLTVTHGIHVFGNEDAAAWSLGYGNACYISLASAGITNVKTTSTGIERSAMCKTDKFIPLDESWIEGFYNHNKVAFSLSNDNYFAFNTGSAMTKQECKAFIAGTQLYYPLATPTTVQLTPTEVKTLLGYNNIFSSGTVDVIYHADTKLYVDKMTTVDNAIIAPTEADFVATRNYTVNDLLIVADTLYKVIANIASGSAITPNSNVQQTTLGALIKALS